jgi:protein SCO1/2
MLLKLLRAILFSQQIHPKGRCPAVAGSILTLFVFLATACSTALNSVISEDIYEGTQIDGAAPDFQLIDQNGQTLTLADFQGQVVVLTFLDSRCQDTCPLTAADLRRTHQALGDAAHSVVFLGVNVNVNANTRTDITAATQEWHLDEISTWHFLTGNSTELETVWESYHIEVIPPMDESGDLSHSPGVYLIDRSGQQRWYVSTPFVGLGTAAPSRPLSELLTMHIEELLSES